MGADLSTAFCKSANFFMADLRSSVCTEINLQQTDLQGANLREANLSRAQIQDAKMSGAELRGAILHAADFLYALGITVKQASEGETDERTRWPTYLRADRSALSLRGV